MSTKDTNWVEEFRNIGGTEVQMISGGTGEPLLILHDEMGHHSCLKYHEALSKFYKIYIPSHPGFGKSPTLPWIMNMRDMAGCYLHILDDLALGPVNVVGFSIGAWLASELASMCPHQFKKLVLVSPMGIKPPAGEIRDMFLELSHDFITAGFLNPSKVSEFKQVCPDEPSPEQSEAWEVAREQSARLAWRPYMFYPALPDLLGRLKTLQTLIVCGQQDAIVPISASQAYHEALPASRLAVMENCGHRPEIEHSAEFVNLVRGFLME